MVGLIDYYLRFITALDAEYVLDEYRTTDETGNPCWILASDDHALDVIGVIPGMTGFHVNLRSRTPMEFPFNVLVTPEHPYRVWA